MALVLPDVMFDAHNDRENRSGNGRQGGQMLFSLVGVEVRAGR